MSPRREKIPIKAIRPQGRPYRAAVWFPPRDIDISPPQSSPTCLEILGWALHVGEWKSMWDTGKGVSPRAWIEGSMRV